jgi:hypothetical protein
LANGVGQWCWPSVANSERLRALDLAGIEPIGRARGKEPNPHTGNLPCRARGARIHPAIACWLSSARVTARFREPDRPRLRRLLWPLTAVRATTGTLTASPLGGRGGFARACGTYSPR